MAAGRREAAGGIVGRDFLKVAGAAATLGIAPIHLLRADRTERELLIEIAQHAAEFAADRDAALANKIIAEYAQARKRGK